MVHGHATIKRQRTFLSLILPGTSTRQSRYPGPVAVTVTLTLPSSMSNTCPGSDASMISGCGSRTRLVVPGVGSRSKRKVCPVRSSSPSGLAKVPTRSLGPCRSPSTAMGWSYFSSTGSNRVELLLLRVLAVGKVEPKDVGARQEQAFRSFQTASRPVPAWPAAWSSFENERSACENSR